MLSIRRGVLEDAKRMAELELIIFPEDPWSYESLANEFSGINDTRYFVAEENGTVIGYAGLWAIKPEADIVNVGVHPDARRKGVAGRLLTALIDDAEDDGITDITLEVRISNRPAIALYEGFGFESAGVRRGYYQNGEDALIMWRRKEVQ